MRQNNSQLVIRDVPILQWVLGILFAGGGTLVLLDGGQPVFGAIFAAVGLGFLLFSSVLTITANRMKRTLKLDYRSALHHTWKVMSFDEIAGINVERRASPRRGFTYRLTLLRKDGQVIPFRSSSSTGWKGKERCAGRLREYLGIQDCNHIPAGILPTELTQATEIHETNGVHWRIQPMYTASSSAPTGARWHSSDYKTPGGIFLFVTQKAEGQPSGGLLASLGSVFIRQALSLHGFSPEDTPGLEQAVPLAPLEPALERHFMAYTNSPSSAHQLLNSRTTARLADWAARYPLKSQPGGSGNGQLMTLFGPNGVYLATLNLLEPSQAHELAFLGVELVKSQ